MGLQFIRIKNQILKSELNLNLLKRYLLQYKKDVYLHMV